MFFAYILKTRFLTARFILFPFNRLIFIASNNSWLAGKCLFHKTNVYDALWRNHSYSASIKELRQHVSTQPDHELPFRFIWCEMMYFVASVSNMSLINKTMWYSIPSSPIIYTENRDQSKNGRVRFMQGMSYIFIFSSYKYAKTPALWVYSFISTSQMHFCCSPIQNAKVLNIALSGQN